MKLITEVVEDVEVITEAKEGGGKNHWVRGIVMQGNIKNRNGRVYPTKILEREMKRYDRDYIKTSRALGELGHPEGPSINADRVSHIITEMYREGDNFIGKAKVLATPMGNIVKTFIDEGVKFGISTRGLGTVKNKNGINEVQEDFFLACADLVADPSGPDCFLEGILENAEWVFDSTTKSWRTAQIVEHTKSQLLSKQRIDEARAVKMFDQFVKSLSSTKR